jgi:hypothetical protein
VLASRRPEHPVGWLLLGVGLAVALNLLVEGYAKYGLLVRPGSLPGARYLVGFAVASFTVIWLSCAGFVLLLTPTGSLPSPGWRWWARVAAAAPVMAVVASVVQPDPLAPDWYGNPLAVPALYRLLVIPGVAGIVVVLLSVLVGAGSLVVRSRRARGVERLQLRWLALAAALAAGLLLVALVAGYLGRDPVVLACMSLCVALLPLATGAAILRDRLYDLDRIVSRTLTYGLLTVLLGLGYAGVVLGLGRLLPHASSLVVAAAATTPPASWRPSPPACATRSTWGRCTASCWRWSTRPCSRPAPRSGCGRRPPDGRRATAGGGYRSRLSEPPDPWPASARSSSRRARTGSKAAAEAAMPAHGSGLRARRRRRLATV